MKKIDTSAITSGGWMPVLGNLAGNNFVNGADGSTLAGLDFLQQAYFECINALSQFIILDQTQPTIMYVKPNPPHEISMITEGFVSYLGEIYYFATSPQARLSINTGTYYQNANIVTDYSTADPVKFSDSNLHKVHQIRQVQFSSSPTRNAGNMPDYDLWHNASTNSYANALAQVTLNNWISATYNDFVSKHNTNLSPTVYQVGVGSAPAFSTGWVNALGIPQRNANTPSPLSFYKMWNRVYMWGEVTYSGTSNEESTIFQLPSDYWPLAYEEVFEVWDTASMSVAGNHNATPGYYLVITNDGYVKVLSNNLGSRTFSFSGINFTYGSYVLLSDLIAEESSHSIHDMMFE